MFEKYIAGNKMQFKAFKRISNVRFVIYKDNTDSYMEGKLVRARLFLRAIQPVKISERVPIEYNEVVSMGMERR